MRKFSKLITHSSTNFGSLSNNVTTIDAKRNVRTDLYELRELSIRPLSDGDERSVVALNQTNIYECTILELERRIPVEDLPQSRHLPDTARDHLGALLCVRVPQTQNDLARRGLHGLGHGELHAHVGFLHGPRSSHRGRCHPALELSGVAPGRVAAVPPGVGGGAGLFPERSRAVPDDGNAVLVRHRRRRFAAEEVNWIQSKGAETQREIGWSYNPFSRPS